MSDGALIGMLVIALGIHVALARANRRLGAGQEHARGGRISALLTHIATAAAIAGWGALALGLVLDAVHVHALSTVLAAIVVLMIPLALLCLSASLAAALCRPLGRPQVCGEESVSAHMAIHQGRDPAAGHCAAGTGIVGLAGGRGDRGGNAGDRSRAATGSDEDRRSAIGAYYNYRTGQYDDGSDPDGIYHDKPYQRYCPF